jgi:hypothetical protein
MKIKIFRYLPNRDAFVVTDAYGEIAEQLGLTEWNPVVWIGRLFTLDNDYGEHWFDNWELTENPYDYFHIDPDRFMNGKDGPCNTPEFRKRFWTDVLQSLELSLDLLFDKARQLNEEKEKDDYKDDYIANLEERIAQIRKKYER